MKEQKKSRALKIFINNKTRRNAAVWNLYGIFLISLFIGTFSGCEKPQSYSSTPEITMKSYSVVDTVDTLGNSVRQLTLTFNFVDGDGNLSSSDDRPLVTILPDTIPQDTTTYSKIFLKLYEKKQGAFTVIPDSTLLTPTSFLIPYGDAMSREGQNKTQKGEMSVKYTFYYSQPNNTLPYDTLQIDLYLTDLAYEKSNVVTSTNIALKKK